MPVNLRERNKGDEENPEEMSNAAANVFPADDDSFTLSRGKGLARPPDVLKHLP
jgi:hypothetical protein